MSGDIDGSFSYPLAEFYPEKKADVLLTLGAYLLDIISPILGCVPKSSTCPWTHLNNYRPERWQITGQEHFSHQLNEQLCLTPCHHPFTNMWKQQSGFWDLKMFRNVRSLIKWLNHLPLGCISNFVYCYPPKKNLTSNGPASSRLLTHSSSQDSRNNSSFNIMNDSARP